MAEVPEYPQKEMQADDSLRLMLWYQAEALFPKESEMLRDYKLPAKARICDVGCGCGEIAKRIALLFPEAEVLGVDLEERNIKQANTLREQQPDSVQKRLRFQTGNAFSLSSFLPADHFDLVVCRSLLYAVQKPELIIAQILKVVKKSASGSRGVVHLMVEDMGAIHYSPMAAGAVNFWIDGVSACFANTKTDPFAGRCLYPLLHSAVRAFLAEHKHTHASEHEHKDKPTTAVSDVLSTVRVQYLIADTCNTPRETLAHVFRKWQEGYTTMIANNCNGKYSQAEVTRYFDDIVNATLNEKEGGFASWQNYVCSVTL